MEQSHLNAVYWTGLDPGTDRLLEHREAVLKNLAPKTFPQKVSFQKKDPWRQIVWCQIVIVRHPIEWAPVDPLSLVGVQFFWRRWTINFFEKGSER